MHGAPSIRFNLKDLYQSIDDPAIDHDLDEASRLAHQFQSQYQGKLGQLLGDALAALGKIHTVSRKVFLYLHLCQACDAANQSIQRVSARALEAWSAVQANHLLFFQHEVAFILRKEDLEAQAQSDPRVAKHIPFLYHIRKQAQHRLSPEVERALLLRSPFGPHEWNDYLEEIEVQTSFLIRTPELKSEPFWGKKLSFTEILKLSLHHEKSAVRFQAMKAMNHTLGKARTSVAARGLNALIGQKNLEDNERKYPHPMAAMNLENKVSAETVEALHLAVRAEGARQAKRYYSMLAQHLGKKQLLWSDRTARFRDTTAHYSWSDAVAIVKNAWSAFSPTLVNLVETMLTSQWVDASIYPGKSSGAFNYSALLPGNNDIRSYTFLNFQGSDRDVMTLAHEFGHGVHGILAAEAQGPLMWGAPMAYAETASIFGEMLVFDHLRRQAPDSNSEFCLLMEKCSDFLNSVVRQISFSLFEQRVHERRKKGKLTVKEFSEVWMACTEELYGKHGEIFDFTGIENLWSYVSHFMSPFYVYAYAFGELLTQSLFSVKDKFGTDFEPMYLDLLKAGGTKNAEELLKPFGLNPQDPDFWKNGIRGSIGAWLDRAEEI